MKYTLKILSLILALVLCVGLMTACSSESENQETEATKGSTAPVETLPDNPNKDIIGVINFSGTYCIGLDLFFTTDVIDSREDYIALDLSTLIDAKDHTTINLADKVVYKLVRDGVLLDSGAAAIREGCTIAVIEEEDKSQTIIILSLPEKDK